MERQEIKDYIKEQRAKGKSDKVIYHELRKLGCPAGYLRRHLDK